MQVTCGIPPQFLQHATLSGEKGRCRWSVPRLSPPQNPRCTLYAGLVRSFPGSKCWLWRTMVCVQLPVSLLASVVAQAGGEVSALSSLNRTLQPSARTDLRCERVSLTHSDYTHSFMSDCGPP